MGWAPPDDDGALRVGCVQLGGEALGDPGARRAHADGVLAGLADAVDLLVLPELWPAGFFRPDAWESLAEPLDGPTARWAARLARARGCWVHSGSFVERRDGRLHNTSLLLDPAGEVRLVYRKVHLFPYRSAEADLLTPGDAMPVVPLGPARVAASTCFDLRFPELFRSAVADGADLLLVTSAWPAARRDHWRLLCQARAVESQAWLVACNATGSDGGVEVAGSSLVVDPWGEVVADGGPEEGVLVADVDLARTAQVRGEYPFLAAARPDLWR